MQQSIVVCGVGGQGILTIASAISAVALANGLEVRQAETHGMSQRGGAASAQLRYSDRPIHSDLLPLGSADLVLSLEPLESLRYVQWLGPRGLILTSTAPFHNIDEYPDLETILSRVAAHPRHCLVDAERLARDAGSVRAANAVMLGAASPFLTLPEAALEDAFVERFVRESARLVEINRLAFRLGRDAARASYP